MGNGDVLRLRLGCIKGFGLVLLGLGRVARSQRGWLVRGWGQLRASFFKHIIEENLCLDFDS